MNVTAIKSYNRVFKQNFTDTPGDKANNLAIDNTRADEFISSKNTTRDNKKNNTWKWLLGTVITAALIVGLFVEKKAKNAAKAEKEAAEKAKKELEEKLKKEKEEFENKLKENQKKWDDFFKNNPTNNEKKAPPSNNSASSNNTNSSSSHSSGSNSSTPSQSGKNPSQSVDVISNNNTTTKEMLEESIEKTKKIDERNEQLKREIENIENEGNTEISEQNKQVLDNYRIKKEEELSRIPEARVPIGEAEYQKNQFDKIKQEMRESYKLNINSIYSNSLKNSLEQKLKIKSAIKEANGDLLVFCTPDERIANDLICTSAEELNYIVKTVSVDELNNNTLRNIKSLLPSDDKKILWKLVDLEGATPQQLSNIKEFLQTVKNEAIEGVLIASTDKPIVIENIKNNKIFLDNVICEDDIAQILERIIKPFTKDNVDFKKLSIELIKNANGNYYSYDALSSIARERIMEITNTNSEKIIELITEQELLQMCRKCKPDITKEMLESLKIK